MSDVSASLARASADYVAANPASAAYRARASRHLPGGGTRSSYHFEPFPLVLRSGRGDYCVDLDGRARLDLNANFGVNIHGQCFGPVVAAVAGQAQRALCFAAPNALEDALAERIARRFARPVRVRFASSGTEAAMAAMRAARSYSGRPLIAKLRGGYHGSSPLGTAGAPGAAPTGDPDPSILVAPDIDALIELVDRRRDDLAGVILEPVLGAGGLIPIAPDRLAELRRRTAHHGQLLMFDEVMMFRVAPGGVQSLIDVVPDLTVLGKLIGGGLPVGALCGAEEIMAVFDPYREGSIALAGTYNGNPMTMAAGIACLDALEPEDYARMDRIAEMLAASGNALLARAGVPACLARYGPFFCIHALPRPATTHAQLQGQDRALLKALHLALINCGVLLTPIGLGVVTTRTGGDQVDGFAAAFARAVQRYFG